MSSKDKKDKRASEKKDKDKDKKKDKERKSSSLSAEDEEQDVFSLDFDKNLFPYQRVKYFSAPNQLEAKLKMKSGTGGGAMKERYAVVHCNFMIYYEVTKAGIPRDSEKPIGAHKLEDMKPDDIKKYEKEIISGGLIPKMRYFDFAFSVPIAGIPFVTGFILRKQQLFDSVYARGASSSCLDKTYVFELSSEDELKTWLKSLPKQIKNVQEFKAKTAAANPLAVIEELNGKYPMANHIGQGPIKDEEDRWIETMRGFTHIRNEHFKLLRRCQLYIDYYNPGTRAYIDWFVTPGGEAGKASLEKDILNAEDNFVGGWKKDGLAGFEETEKEVAEIDSLEKAKTAAEKIAWKIRELNLYKKYQKEVYNRDTETFRDELARWAKAEAASRVLIDKHEKLRADEAAKRLKDAELEYKRREEERRRKEEERRNDPFSDLNIDQGDPFADCKVEGI